VLATITDRKIPKETGTPNGIADYYVADIATVQDYYPFGMVMPGRNWTAGTAEGYGFGFNGKLKDNDISGNGNIYDYGARIYNPRIGKFLSVDPMIYTYPMLTPFQFASNSPISGVDLDGLEYYFAADGTYIGHIDNKDEVLNNIIFVITTSEMTTYNSDLNKIHQAVNDKKIDVQTIPVGETSTETAGKMTIQQLLDLAHLTYGEGGGKQSNEFAHAIWNGEQKAANAISWFKSNNYGENQETREKIPHDETNSKALADLKNVGGQIIYYNIYLINLPREWSETMGVLHNGNPAYDYESDGDIVTKNGDPIVNNNYQTFFKYKNDVNLLYTNIPITKEIIGNIFSARLGTSVDPNPNADSWKGKGSYTNFYVGRNTTKDGKSD